MLDKREHLYQEIAEAMRRRIASGDLKPGDRLPAVRQLAKDWSCTPGTVGRAYRVLNEEGLVVSHRGQGTRVAESTVLSKQSWNAEGADVSLRWARLVNRAEQYLLAAAGSGYSLQETQTALSIAVARWREIRDSYSDRDGETTGTAGERTLRFSGSHDLAVESLGGWLRAYDPPVELTTTFNGSLGGLMALLRREADIGGTHLWDEETDTYNEAHIRRLFPGEAMMVLTVAHRSVGLIQNSAWGAPGDKVNSLEALASRELRLANRQRGSGTRLWLDAQLRRLNIDHQTIKGYETELATHMAVARRVASGEADVGLGIFAAAAALGLDFTPLTREKYELVFLKAAMPTGRMQALIEIFGRESTRRAIDALGGYDTTETGNLRELGEVPPSASY